MAFMEPQYRNGKFARIENRSGESRSLPLEDVEPDDFDHRADEKVAEVEEGWFWRISAEGFMDCTEWVGPFQSLLAAKRDCRDTHEIDPETGEDLPEEE